MPRGGKRPGAGAPRGNTNAIKTGRYSKRFMAVAKGLASVPEVNAFILDYRKRQLRQERKAARIAFKSLLNLLIDMPEEARKNNPTVAYVEDLLAKLEKKMKNGEQSVGGASIKHR
ncbi:MAG: hypothetical protein HY681_11315 [Chloroflexi bacterium]|nr:hypothetical protein [Chloroflexota bacterium]